MKEQLLPRPARKAHPIKLFISHDHRDADIAEALVDYIQGRVSILDSAIRCTSLDRCALPNGADPDVQLPEELRHAAMVIGVVTPTSRRSDWVLFEIGARWGMGPKHLAVVLPPYAEFDILPKPMRGRVAARLHERARMIRLATEVAEGTGHPLVSDALRADKALTRLIEFAGTLHPLASEATPAPSARPEPGLPPSTRPWRGDAVLYSGRKVVRVVVSCGAGVCEVHWRDRYGEESTTIYAGGTTTLESDYIWTVEASGAQGLCRFEE